MATRMSGISNPSEKISTLLSTAMFPARKSDRIRSRSFSGVRKSMWAAGIPRRPNSSAIQMLCRTERAKTMVGKP